MTQQNQSSPQPKPKRKPIFSIIAIVMPFLFFGIMFIIGNYFLKIIDPSYKYHVIGGIASLFLIGFISSIIAFLRNERSSLLKWLGALINAAVIVFYLFVIFLD
ncbi:MAG: hypothetical protein P1U56_17505 [Saprospiraceae bacterium]|nr:hypothetical protein [Saprospiraceae bacterium]